MHSADYHDYAMEDDRPSVIIIIIIIIYESCSAKSTNENDGALHRITLSHTSILSKRLHISSKFFHHRVATPF